MNTFTHVNINTPSTTIFSDKFIDDYIVCREVFDENGNKISILDFIDIEAEAINNKTPE